MRVHKETSLNLSNTQTTFLVKKFGHSLTQDECFVEGDSCFYIWNIKRDINKLRGYNNKLIIDSKLPIFDMYFTTHVT